MHEKLSALELAQEMLDGLEGVTPGPWEVVEDKHPWMLPACPEWGRPEERHGEHSELRIFTTWEDAQLKARWPVVNVSVGISCEPKQPIHMLHIKAEDAAHIARCSPENIALLCRALLAERKPTDAN